MWDVIEKCDFRFFFFCRKYFCEFVFVIMLDHFIVYVSTARLEFFRDDERDLIWFFEVTEFWQDDSSSLTKATHQTWRKRLIKFDKQYFVKFDRLYFIKFDKEHLIKSDERYVASSDTEAGLRDHVMWLQSRDVTKDDCVSNEITSIRASQHI
jgi:hypothetical protein